MRNYHIIKGFCSKICLVGPGNFWFEENTIGNDKSLLRRTCNFTLISTYILMTILEMMACFIGDFPEDEKRTSVTFTVAHTIVMIKITSLIWNKELIKGLNKRMIEVCERIEEPSLMDEKYRTVKLNVLTYAGIVFASVLSTIFEGLRKLFVGSHFVVIVTYYPAFEDDSLPATITRIVMLVILCLMMITMVIAVDAYTIVYLIMYKYKFITLRRYFNKLDEEFHKLNDSGDKMMARVKLYEGLVKGVIMHAEVLEMGKDVHKAFGNVLTCQLVLSSGPAVTLLLQIALADEFNFLAAIKVLFFVGALFFLLGILLCNAGEITYQASLLSDSIFYCGWYACPPRHGHRHIRKLIHISIVQAQIPLVMKSFKMVQLTYGTFLSVVKLTYTVFTLFYAQHQQ